MTRCFKIMACRLRHCYADAACLLLIFAMLFFFFRLFHDAAIRSIFFFSYFDVERDSHAALLYAPA